MKFYIREWSESTIVLMTENGHVLSYFQSVAEALDACSEWYNSNINERQYEVRVQYRQDKSAYVSLPVFGHAVDNEIAA